MVIASVFRVFDEMLEGCRRVVVAYSGGKDSTAMSLMLFDWILSRNAKNIEVVFINVDTLSEIPAMREWSVEFMEEMVRRSREIGVSSSYMVSIPDPVETFYWRVLVRGYPAPTYSFRWCVELLKRRPSRRIANLDGSIMLLGHRDEESSARARTMKQRLGFCPLSAGRCASYYLQVEGNSRKLYPIRDLLERDIWEYLRNKKEEFNLNKLFELYGYGMVKARYGCWHCTLIKYQIGHYILGSEYMYLEAARLIYKWISDIPELRARKDKGYSRMGYLLQPARTIMLYTLEVAERLSGLRLYGLDEVRIDGHSLRELFYELSPSEANKVVRSIEHEYLSSGRIYSIEDLRHASDKSAVFKIIDYIRSKAERLSPSLWENPSEYIIKILDKIEELVR